MEREGKGRMEHTVQRTSKERAAWKTRVETGAGVAYFYGISEPLDCIQERDFLTELLSRVVGTDCCME